MASWRSFVAFGVQLLGLVAPGCGQQAVGPDGGSPGAEVAIADGGQPDTRWVEPDAMDSATPSADVPAVDVGLPDVACLCDLVGCRTSTCDLGSCVYSLEPDGTSCIDPSGDGVCSAGACVPRVVTCGDGIRRLTGPEREACDDGNLLEGDACDGTCTPSVFFVTPVDGEFEAPPGPRAAVAVDGRGFGAYVWTEEGAPAIWARIYDPGGVPVSDAILIVDAFPNGGNPAPTIAGLSSGWVIAWEDQTLETSAFGIGFSILSATGAVSPRRLANSLITSAQTQPAIARTPDGFVMAWSDMGSRAYLPGAVMLRHFTEDGTARGPETVVSPEDVALRLGGATPSLAVNRDGVILVAWSQTGPGFDGMRTVRARRTTRSGAVDGTSIIVDAGFSLEPQVAALESGDFAIAWYAGTVDFGGDIHAARIPASGSVTITPIILADAATDETSPAVVPLAGDAFLVAWELGTNRGIGMRAVPDAALPTEALPPVPLAEAGGLGQWSFGRALDATPAGDRRVWASFGGYERRRARAVLGYLFSADE